MDIVESLFLEIVQIQLRQGAGLLDAANHAKFIMEQDMEGFLVALESVRSAGVRTPAKKAKAE